MEGANDSVAGIDPRYPVTNGSDLAGAVGKRHDTELCRTATAAFEDHQIAVVKRVRASKLSCEPVGSSGAGAVSGESTEMEKGMDDDGIRPLRAGWSSNR